MSTESTSSQELAELVRLDQLKHFRQGNVPRSEKYLRDLPALRELDELVVTTVYREYLLRVQLGEKPDRDEFLGRFPRYSQQLNDQFDFRDALTSVDWQDAEFESSGSGTSDDTSGYQRMFAESLNAQERFEVLHEVGRGRFGVVYKAFDRERHELVALKTMRKKNPLSLTRLRSEFRSLVGIEHRNLVTLFEAHSDEESTYFTMQFIDGVSIDEFIQVHRGVRRYPIIHKLLIDVLNGLAALHRNGQLHRDIKPSNVLIDPSNRAVLIDFGLVGCEDQDAETQNRIMRYLVGTPAFMAPEIVRGEPATYASDLYSVGVMLYSLITGQIPFNGTAIQIQRAKSKEEYVKPATLKPEVPSVLDQCVQRLLSVDARGRPDCEELLSALAEKTRGLNKHAGLNGRNQKKPQRDRPRGNRPESGGVSKAVPAVNRSREKQLSVLARAFARSVNGNPGLVNVCGFAGMGKTHLVRQFIQKLNAANAAQTLYAECLPQENIACKIFDSLVHEVIVCLRRDSLQLDLDCTDREYAALASQFPELRRFSEFRRARRKTGFDCQDEKRAETISGVAKLIQGFGGGRPLVVCVDNVQSADVESIAMLQDLIPELSMRKLLWISCYRSEEQELSNALRVYQELICRSDNPVLEIHEIELSLYEQVRLHLVNRAAVDLYIVRPER